MKFIALITTLLYVAAAAYAQNSVDIKPGIISYVEGQAYLNGTILSVNTRPIQKLSQGNSLQTGAGKAEVQLGIAGTMWMGNRGILRMESSDLKNIQLRVEKGSVFIEIIQKNEGCMITLHSGNAVILLREIGIYRLDSELSQLRVYNGEAEINLKDKKVLIPPGKFGNFANQLKTSKFKDKKLDVFNYWTSQRSQLLYEKIHKDRKEAYIKQQWRDLKQARADEDAARRDAREAIGTLRSEEAKRVFDIQQATSPNLPPTN
jgi:hypothetical protein